MSHSGQWADLVVGNVLTGSIVVSAEHCGSCRAVVRVVAESTFSRRPSDVQTDAIWLAVRRGSNSLR
jgi:hypothetical protein